MKVYQVVSNSTEADMARGAKRRHGEGTIVERTDGRWAGAIMLPDGQRKWVYGKTAQETRRKVDRLKADREAGIRVGEGTQTLAQYFQSFLRTMTVNDAVAPRTADNYALNVRRVTPHIGKVRLNRLTSTHINACYAELRKQGLSPASVSQAHRVLRAALHLAEVEGLILRSPMLGVKEPCTEPRLIHPFSDDELRLLLRESDGNRYHLLWALLATTGLRVGDALGLQWNAIDLDAGLLNVQQAVKPIKGKGLQFGPLKTSRSKRIVGIPPTVLAWLKEEQSAQHARSLDKGLLWQESALVFATATGGPWDPGTVNHAFHRLLGRCGLEQRRVHDLRHTAASRLARLGHHGRVVQDFLGHTSVMMTLDTYTHLGSHHQPIAAEMETLFETQDKEAS